MLYVARHDDPAHQHGTIFWVHESVFAPDPAAPSYHKLGSLNATAFRIGYVDQLRALWHQDRQAFLDLAAGGTDLTLVDDWADEPEAPRRILAAARTVAR